MYTAEKLGALDKNASTRRSGFDFVVIHDGGYHPSPKHMPKRRKGRGETAVRDVLNQWLKKNSVGSHYYITYDGTVWQFLSERLTIGHAGCGRKAKEGQCVPGVNRRSIGIDLQAPTDGRVTEAQYRSLSNLISDICRRRNIPQNDKHILAHFQAKKRNHYDPKEGFKWHKVKGVTYDHYEKDHPSKIPGMWANWPNAGGDLPQK